MILTNPDKYNFAAYLPRKFNTKVHKSFERKVAYKGSNLGGLAQVRPLRGGSSISQTGLPRRYTPAGAPHRSSLSRTGFALRATIPWRLLYQPDGLVMNSNPGRSLQCSFRCLHLKSLR